MKAPQIQDSGSGCRAQAACPPAPRAEREAEQLLQLQLLTALLAGRPAGQPQLGSRGLLRRFADAGGPPVMLALLRGNGDTGGAIISFCAVIFCSLIYRDSR
jgi:hypothetical protein